MPEELVCPDCGGFIGLEPGDARQACNCFTPPISAAPPKTELRPAIARMMKAQAALAPAKRPEEMRLGGDSIAGADASITSSDTQHIPSDVAAPAPPGKVCRKCGKDLTGKKRLKDSLGYICPECVKAEETVDTTGRVACPECDRKIKPAGFVPFNGKMICRRCFADHMELDKYKTAAPSAAGFVKREKQSLGRLMLFAGVLFLLMAWSFYRNFLVHR